MFSKVYNIHVNNPCYYGANPYLDDEDEDDDDMGFDLDLESDEDSADHRPLKRRIWDDDVVLKRQFSALIPAFDPRPGL